MNDARAQLLDIVRQRGHLRMAEPVQLSSGEWSRDFVDGKRALARGGDLRFACEVAMEAVTRAGVDFDAVGGLTMGADHLAHGVAMIADRDWFVVRKQPKGRGTDQLVEGARLGDGVRVLLVEDVVSTGGSVRQAYQAIGDTGATVVAAVTLLDRGDVAAAFFAEVGVPYFALLTYRELGIGPIAGGNEVATG